MMTTIMNRTPNSMNCSRKIISWSIVWLFWIRCVFLLRKSVRIELKNMVEPFRLLRMSDRAQSSHWIWITSTHRYRSVAIWWPCSRLPLRLPSQICRAHRQQWSQWAPKAATTNATVRCKWLAYWKQLLLRRERNHRHQETSPPAFWPICHKRYWSRSATLVDRASSISISIRCMSRRWSPGFCWTVSSHRNMLNAQFALIFRHQISVSTRIWRQPLETICKQTME